MGLGASLVVGTATYSPPPVEAPRFQPFAPCSGLFSGGLLTFHPALATAFALGFASHVLLDLLNKMPVQLFYPSKRGRLCFRLCYASGATNTAFMWVGAFGIVAGMTLPLTGVT